MHLRTFLLAFIPIFVAIDAVGLLPFFVMVSHSRRPAERARLLSQSLLTALALGLVFLFLGKAVFRFLGIEMGDFMIAGGGILFAIALVDLLGAGARKIPEADELGVVPLGTPMIAGPAFLTTVLLLDQQYGLWPVLASVLCNLAILGLVLKFSESILGWVGKAGARALSKVVSLFLGAIAVMMVRKGLELVLALR